MSTPLSWLDAALLHRLGWIYFPVNVLLLIGWVYLWLNPPPVPQPLLKMELAGSCDKVSNLIQAVGEKKLRAALWTDYGIILGYGSALALAGLVLLRRGGPLMTGLGAAGLFCGVAGAVADVIENQLSFQVLRMCTEKDLARLSAATHWKWGLIAAALLLLSSLFFSGGRWSPTVGALFLIAGAVAAWGIARKHELLDPALGLIVLALAGFALLLLVQPRRLLGLP